MDKTVGFSSTISAWHIEQRLIFISPFAYLHIHKSWELFRLERALDLFKISLAQLGLLLLFLLRKRTLLHQATKLIDAIDLFLFHARIGRRQPPLLFYL